MTVTQIKPKNISGQSGKLSVACIQYLVVNASCPYTDPHYRLSLNQPIVSPISLLDHVRDAMLRLIMVTAVSKSAPASHSNIHHANNSSLRQSYASPSARNDTDHSQAVAECIEFIKKRSVYGCVLDEKDLESSSFEPSSSLDGIPQLGMPFSVL
ncbi:hypothetical protein QQ045_024207 [Rhodiola kirilowii]